MSFEVYLGWWLAPALWSFAMFAFAALMTRGDGRPDQYGAGAVISLVGYLAAAVSSLGAWFIWAAFQI